MNIVRLRISRALVVHHRSTALKQKQNPNSRRRGSRKPGVIAKPHSVNVRLTEAQLARLDATCAALNVERGLIIRDALDFYLGMAEQEFRENADVPTQVRAAAPDKLSSRAV